MHITQLNWECLLHIFSFLDKNSRKRLAQTCRQLLRVFQDPLLWPLLYFQSPAELTKGNFVLGPALRYLSISWHSSRVKVCNIEDWMKSAFQRDICSTHEHIVNDFLLQVCNRTPSNRQTTCTHLEKSLAAAFSRSRKRHRAERERCPNLLSLTLSGCGHVTDDYLTLLLKSCPCLRTLQLENCVQITDQTLEAVALYADCLQTLHVDFCRNITQAGLQRIQKTRPSITLKAERSANMIPDKKPGTIWASERALKKLLWH